ncbi:MAG TPA: deoxyribonuclease V [Burkholderiales bacterium]
MKLQHRWDLTPAEAVALQESIRHRVETRDRLGAVRHVAGVDVGFEHDGATTRAAVAVLGFPGLEPADVAVARLPTRFPYVPGLLSFREIPAVLQALAGLRIRPDLLLCDGQGVAHPRRIGLASHLGLAADLPSIGVAKTRLIGSHGVVPNRKGAWTPLLDGDEVVGAVLRSRKDVRPLYVSSGHRVCLETAIRFVMACITRYRLPETTRYAHRLASGGTPELRRLRARLRASAT